MGWFFKEYYWDDQIKENQTSRHVKGIGEMKNIFKILVT
jgi:hypothetical protein